MNFETSALLVSWLAIFALAAVVARLVQQVHYLQSNTTIAQTMGLRPGFDLPESLTESLNGLSMSDGIGVIAFVQADCPSCERVLDELSRFAESRAASIPILAILPGTDVPEPLPGIRFLSNQSDLFRTLRISITPFVTLSRDGRVIESRPIGSAHAMTELLSQIPHERRAS